MTSTTPSITAALAEAETQFGGVHRFLPQPNGWGYTRWSEQHNAWWSPQIGHHYSHAMTLRAWDVAAAAACIILQAEGADDETLVDIEAWAEQFAEDTTGLTRHERVRRLLSRARR